MTGREGKSAFAMTVAGFASGAIAYWVSAPLWLLKTLGQLQAQLAPIDCRPGPFALFRGLWNEGGMPRLFRGSGCLVVRGACLSAGNFLGYDGAKTIAKLHGLLDDGPVLHLVASVLSAAVGTAMAAPADVAMAYVHSARLRQGGEFKGVMACVKELVQIRGLRGLYRGYPVFFMTKTPSFMINMTVYEQTRRLLGLEYMD